MGENKLEFLKTAFPGYQVRFSDDFSKAVIVNPLYEENITVYYEEGYDFEPFIACFSFQHGHFETQEDVIAWVGEIIAGRTLAIEFFRNGQRYFGGEIEAEKLQELSYTMLERFSGYYGGTKLWEVADSFKIRGWDKKNDMDVALVSAPDGAVALREICAGSTEKM